MGSLRKLLKNVSLSESKRRHFCHSNKKHELKKGDRIFVVKEGRTATHYCVPCAERFVALARKTLDQIDQDLKEEAH